MNWCFTALFFIVATSIVAVGVVMSHEMAVYKEGKRPWFALTDRLCGIFLHAKRDNLVVQIPVTGRDVRRMISHRWRGNYQFSLWISDMAEVTEKIGMRSIFRDKNGKCIFEQVYSPDIYTSWRTTMSRPGRSCAFWMYDVPTNVPLDNEVIVEISLLGEVENFLAKHPSAKIVLLKERDK